MVSLDAVVCDRCRDFLPGTIRADLDASAVNPALVLIVRSAVLTAVAKRPLPVVKPGPRPVGGRPCRGTP